MLECFRKNKKNPLIKNWRKNLGKFLYISLKLNLHIYKWTFILSIYTSKRLLTIWRTKRCTASITTGYTTYRTKWKRVSTHRKNNFLCFVIRRSTIHYSYGRYTYVFFIFACIDIYHLKRNWNNYKLYSFRRINY